MSLQVVNVSKAAFINLLGPTAAMNVGMYFANGTQQSQALLFLFNSVSDLDLNSLFVKDLLLPTLLANNVLLQSDVDRITSYTNAALGL